MVNGAVKHRWFKRRGPASLGKKIGWQTMLLVLGTNLVSGVILFAVILKTNQDSLHLQEQTMRENFDKLIQAEVELAVSMLKQIHQKVQKGTITQEQAKIEGANILRDIRYSGEGYFWADTMDGVNVVLLGKKNVEGKSRINFQDAKGKYIIQEFMKTGPKPGGGFVDYWFPRPGQETPYPKRSYVLSFAPFGWVIGTGNYIDDIDAAILEKKIQIDRQMKFILIALGIFEIVVIILTIVASLRLGNSIARPVGVVAEMAASIASGQLGLTITTDRQDEIGQLMMAMQSMIAKLSTTIGEVRVSANTLLETTQDVSATSEVLNHAASEQASNIEESSANIKDIALTIKQNSSNALTTERIATKTAHDAEVSSGTVVAAMNQVADKIGVIDTIAQQTNLLALNAAIEAARAGEHGKGFAVVATEVRNLANRSQQAAMEIGGLTTDTASMATKLLEELVPSIVQTSDLVREIAITSSAQAEGAEQIIQTFAQIDKASQQTAIASETLTGTAELMNNQAVRLKELMEFFQIEVRKENSSR